MSRKEVEEEEDREALNKAILQSLQSSAESPSSSSIRTSVDPAPSRVADSEEDLRRAIDLSLQESSSPSTSVQDSVEFIRQQRLLRLGQSSSSSQK